MARKKFKILDSVIAYKNQKTATGRSGPEYVETMLDDIAKCSGGVAGCENALILFARDTNLEYRIYVDGGQLVIENVTSGNTSNIIALPV